MDAFGIGVRPIPASVSHPCCFLRTFPQKATDTQILVLESDSWETQPKTWQLLLTLLPLALGTFFTPHWSYPQGHMRGNCLVPGTHSRSQMSGVPRPPFSSSLCPNLCVKTHLCFLFWFCTVGRHYVWVLFSSHFPDSSGIYHCIRDCQLLSSTSHLPPCNPLFL